MTVRSSAAARGRKRGTAAGLLATAFAALAVLAVTSGPSLAAECQYTSCREITVIPPADQEATLGQTQEFQLGSFSDSGGTGPWRVEVDWGEGTGPYWVATVFDEGPIPPVSLALMQDGPRTVRVTVDDGAGQGFGAAEFSIDVTIEDVPVGPGGGAATGPPTPSQPLQAVLQTPLSDSYTGTVTIERQPTTQNPPSSYTFFDQEVYIHATPDSSPGDPYRITLNYESFPSDSGVDHTTVEVFRNGVLIQPCTDPPTADYPVAAPDPCVLQRLPYVSVPVEAGARVTILTSQTSFYNVGYRSFVYPEARLLGPLKSPPALNSAKAGSSVTIKFSLGGDQGPDVIATDYPQSVALDCGTGACPQARPALWHSGRAA